jgi:hypothetical protein
MDNLTQIRRLEELGKQIIKEGFSHEPFAEAMQIYWRVMVQDEIKFSFEHVRLVTAEELERAAQRQGEADTERVYNLLPRRIKKQLTINEMLAIENEGIAGFMQAFQGQGVMLGVYNHSDDICYVLRDIPHKEIWDGHPNAFYARFAAHELGHRYVRQKRDSLEIRGVGNSFWEEKYCRFIEAGFHTYVFKEGNTEEYIQWRREQQRQLGASFFDARADRIATQHFIAKYRDAVKNK